ncbi:hypothetical protein [Latilactobacillus curvatus]|uniref:hypothetical protein n=1 Tax=Latilactobacillus curvatus TaxID=28038 RepID=UPI00223AB341|nr:hypothetical protein [Latilactobacillus curvatus]MCS8616347.1 hypothetical protein [Latilactobacillus curvatus]
MESNLLKAKIIQNGFNTRNFVRALNDKGAMMNAATFYRKVNGTSEFTQTEISVIAKVLKLNPTEVMNIFFAIDVS